MKSKDKEFKKAYKGIWTCTACDKLGTVGCFHGDRQTSQRKAAYLYDNGIRKQAQIRQIQKDIESKMDELAKLGIDIGDFRGELHKRLSAAHDAGQSEVRAPGAQGEASRTPGEADAAAEGDAGSRRASGSNAPRRRFTLVRDDGDLKFSNRQKPDDQAYLDAVNSGDMESAQRMVEGAREKAIAKLSKSLEKTQGDVLFSNRPKTLDPQLRKEYEDTKARYINTPQWLKAPNGQPSNLNEQQWVMVRTPRFKSWFGDFEANSNAQIVVINLKGNRFGGGADAARSWSYTNASGKFTNLATETSVVISKGVLKHKATSGSALKKPMPQTCIWSNQDTAETDQASRPCCCRARQKQ